MARHRDVRNMDYSDDYDGYDDIYGHSVDDEFYISPSDRQFMYNRENSTRSSEGDIKEEDDEAEAQLTDAEKEKLKSCIDQINTILGSKTISRDNLVNIIISQKFNVQQALNIILEDPKVNQTTLGDKKDKDVTTHSKNFFIPKLVNLNNSEPCPNNKINREFNIVKNSGSNNSLYDNNLTKSKNGLIIPKLNIANNEKTNSLQETIKNKPRSSFIIPKLNITNNEKTNNQKTELHQTEPGTKDSDMCEFNSLSELVSNHLSTAPINSQTLFKQVMVDTREIKTVDIKEATNKMAHLQVSNSKSLSSIENNVNSWHIDLSVALKPTQSLHSISNSTHLINSEKFHIPFVNCEENKLIKNKILPSKFDISDILMRHLTNTQHRSSFGKTLCRNYKRRKPIIKRSNYLLSLVKKFDFTDPSPDDIISGHLRR